MVMRKSVVAFFAVLPPVACMALFTQFSFSQDLGQVHEVCSPHEGRCLTIRPPRVPATLNPKIPRTRDGKPAFTGVYAGAGFNHQVGPNDTDTPIISGVDPELMRQTHPRGLALL